MVDELGEGVTEFAVGDEVVGWAQGGSYAEHAIAGIVARKPADLPWEQAVAIPIAGETAARVLRELGLKEGETLLLHGAAGGVGSVGVQLAVALGATVIGTASEANQDYLRELGAIPIAYGDGLVDRVKAVAPQGVDARRTRPARPATTAASSSSCPSRRTGRTASVRRPTVDRSAPRSRLRPGSRCSPSRSSRGSGSGSPARPGGSAASRSPKRRPPSVN